MNPRSQLLAFYFKNTALETALIHTATDYEERIIQASRVQMPEGVLEIIKTVVGHQESSRGTATFVSDAG